MSQSLFWYELKVFKNDQLVKTFNCPRQPIANVLQVLLFNDLNYRIEVKLRDGSIVSLTGDDFKSFNP